MGADISRLSAEEQKKMLANLNVEAKKAVDVGDIDSKEELKKEVMRLRALFSGAHLALSKATEKQYKASKNTLDDGTVIETFGDGRRLQTSRNGSTLEVLPDGTQTQISPDGTKVVKRPDGSMLQAKPDGTCVERLANGTTIQTFANKTTLEVRPDGTKIQTSPDGTVTKLFADKTKIETRKDGHKTIVHPDGSMVQRNPNGTVIETFADKKKVQTKVDGSRIEVYPDGRRIEINVNGDVLEILPDGTQIRKKLKTTNTVTCWKCQTVGAVPMGKFLFTCQMCRTILLAIQKSDTDDKNPEASRQQEVKAVFERFDRAKSGHIDKAGLGEILSELNLGTTAFPEIFTEADANGDHVLQYPEFVIYFRLLQKKFLETASAPMVEAAKDILEKQKEELNKERIRLEAQNAELKARMATDASAKAKFDTAEAQLAKINKQFVQKEKQAGDIMTEQKRRQRSNTQRRLEARKKRR